MIRLLGYLWSIWGVLFFNAGRLLLRFWPADHTISSCLLWSLDRFYRDGGSIRIVKSQYGVLWPHMRYLAPDGEEAEYVPVRVPRRFLRPPKTRLDVLKRCLPLILFKGRVRAVK